MSASYYIEIEAKVLGYAKLMRATSLETLQRAARIAKPLIREAARRELLRRQIWGESK